jgi:YHS domain-containing protein
MLFLKEAAAYSQFLGNKVFCPVSGEAFNIKPGSKKIKYEGKVYFFCCPDCVVLFKANPKKYFQTAAKKQEDKKQEVSSCQH